MSNTVKAPQSKKVYSGFSLRKSVNDCLRNYAARKEISASQFVETAITEKLRREGVQITTGVNTNV